MATPSRKITPTALSQAKDEEEYWRRKSVAAGLKAETLALDSSLAEPTSRQIRGKSLADSYKENYVEGLQIKGFREGLGEQPSNPKPAVSPTALVTEKAAIIRSLASAGKSPEEIETYLSRLGPHLDLAAMASDPLAAQMLYSRVMTSGGQQPTLKDIVEVISLVNQMKSQQPQTTDMAQLATALGTMFRSGVEAAQAKNGNTDPIAMYQAGMNAVTPLLDKLNETQKLAFTAQLDSLRNELREKDPQVFFSKMAEFAQNLGWQRGGSEDPEVIKHRLQFEDQRDQRAFELSKTKWEKEWEMKTETNKQKAQAELLGGITSTLTKALESPVLKTLGQNVGQRLGNPLGPLAEARTKSAQEQLSNPLDTLYGFKCPQCGKDSKFTAGQLTKIGSSGGRWVCSCGAPYTLGSLGGEDKRDNTGVA